MPEDKSEQSQTVKDFTVVAKAVGKAAKKIDNKVYNMLCSLFNKTPEEPEK